MVLCVVGDELGPATLEAIVVLEIGMFDGLVVDEVTTFTDALLVVELTELCVTVVEVVVDTGELWTRGLAVVVVLVVVLVAVVGSTVLLEPPPNIFLIPLKNPPFFVVLGGSVVVLVVGDVVTLRS